jgi:hypothetical protein
MLPILQTRSLCHFSPLTVELAPPIVLVSPPVARPRRLLDIPVTVFRVPFLGMVRQSQTVLEALAADKVAGGLALNLKVVPRGRADVDVCWVCGRPIANLVASIVDNAQLPLRCRLRNFKPVACWHHRSDDSFDREEVFAYCLMQYALRILPAAQADQPEQIHRRRRLWAR